MLEHLTETRQENARKLRNLTNCFRKLSRRLGDYTGKRETFDSSTTDASWQLYGKLDTGKLTEALQQVHGRLYDLYGKICGDFKETVRKPYGDSTQGSGEFRRGPEGSERLLQLPEGCGATARCRAGAGSGAGPGGSLHAHAPDSIARFWKVPVCAQYILTCVI